jgi:hypothetical protein
MIPLRGTAARLALVVLMAAGAVACSSSKKTLILVNVRLGAGVLPPTTVSLTVAAAGNPLGSTEFSWSKAKQDILQAGIFLPAGVTGAVTVDADGTGPFGAKTAGSTGEQTIVAGQTNGPVDLILLAVVNNDDGGTPDSGEPATEADALGPDLTTSEVARVLPDGGGVEVPSATRDGGVAETPPVAPNDGGAEDSPIDGSTLPVVDAPDVDAPAAHDTGPATADAGLGPDSF